MSGSKEASHLLGEVEQVATHVGIIGQGHLLFQGTPAELRRRTRERITLEVDQLEQACCMLVQAGWTAKRSAGSLIVDVDTPQSAADVNMFLVRGGVRVYQLGLERQSLEDIFLQLTSSAKLGRSAA